MIHWVHLGAVNDFFPPAYNLKSLFPILWLACIPYVSKHCRLQGHLGPVWYHLEPLLQKAPRRGHSHPTSS